MQMSAFSDAAAMHFYASWPIAYRIVFWLVGEPEVKVPCSPLLRQPPYLRDAQSRTLCTR